MEVTIGLTCIGPYGIPYEELGMQQKEALESVSTMTREQLWNIYCERNPSFAGDGEVTMSARGLKKLFEQTWDMARQDMLDKQYEPEHQRGSELFEKLFGRSRS